MTKSDYPDYDVTCPKCGCVMTIHASGHDIPGHHWHDTAICHCGQDLGAPYSNPLTIDAELKTRDPSCHIAK